MCGEWNLNPHRRRGSPSRRTGNASSESGDLWSLDYLAGEIRIMIRFAIKSTNLFLMKGGVSVFDKTSDAWTASKKCATYTMSLIW